MIGLRVATPADFEIALARTRAFNAEEGLTVDDAKLQAALRTLLADERLGVYLLIDDGGVIGHALATFGFDLEYGGRDAFLTEFSIDEAARGRGAGKQALEALMAELAARGVSQLHLEVRPENPAVRLYERAGFTRSHRLALTRPLAR